VCFFFNWALRHEGVLGKFRYSSTHSLTSALDKGEWSDSRPGRFTTSERAPGTHWIGGWVGPRTGWRNLRFSCVIYLRYHSSFRFLVGAGRTMKTRLVSYFRAGVLTEYTLTQNKTGTTSTVPWAQKICERYTDQLQNVLEFERSITGCWLIRFFIPKVNRRLKKEKKV
jgi:hypothetical protein